MKCSEVKYQLIEGWESLSEQSKQHLELHLDRCSECASFAQKMNSFYQFHARERVQELIPGLTEQIMAEVAQISVEENNQFTVGSELSVESAKKPIKLFQYFPYAAAVVLGIGLSWLISMGLGPVTVSDSDSDLLQSYLSVTETHFECIDETIFEGL